MKNLLITGGCGFIGSNFIRFLFYETDFDGKVINVDKLTYCADPDSLNTIEKRYPDRYHLIRGDIADHEFMEEVFKRYEIDAVCNFAAQSHVDRAIVDPSEFISTNIVGTYCLLECVRKLSRFYLFHQVSTDEVYGSIEMERVKEDAPFRPTNPYSASKASADHLVRSYANTYGLPITISHSSNNLGPYQFPEKLVPLTILNALEERPIPIYGDGRNIRDWLYVEDNCRAIWMIMCEGKRGQNYNVGSERETENLELVSLLCDILDSIRRPKGIRQRRGLIRFIKDRPGHDRRYAMDCSKIKRELGWSPKYGIEEALDLTIRWYLGNLRWVEMMKKRLNGWIKSHYGKEFL
ncbi:MAG TPA: dTDP-glucose 4,6-dehydratase [Desulfobacteraceae bacterium]|nr:dTDP-glucose 4,6-dehydratase [Desulfobacteraceae bacterium]